MKILLWGWNGRRNLGDDLMTYCLVKYLKKLDTSIEIYIFGNRRKLPAEIRDLSKSVIGHSILKFIPRIRIKLYKQLYPSYFAKKFDLLIIGGGSLFSNIESIKLYNAIATKFLESNKKIISVSTSIGPFKEQAAEQSFLGLFDVLKQFSVRDKRSFDYLLSHAKADIDRQSIQLAPDIAFSLPSWLQLPSIPEEENTVGIAIAQGGFSLEKETSIIKSLDKLLKANSRVKLKIFCFCLIEDSRISDLKLASLYEEKLKEFGSRIEIISYRYNFKDFVTKVLRCKYFFSIRLHSAIIRFSYNKSFFIIPYHQKCYDLATDLELPKTHIIEEIAEDSFLLALNRTAENEKIFNNRLINEAENHFRFIEKCLNY